MQETTGAGLADHEARALIVVDRFQRSFAKLRTPVHNQIVEDHEREVFIPVFLLMVAIIGIVSLWAMAAR